MLKRKYADRAKWVRIIKKRYIQDFLAVPDFKGYAALLFMDKVEKQLWVNHTDKEICIVNDGFKWLQHFPENKNHSVTTIFDENDQIVQWYIDICLQNGLEDDIPFMEDLYLDLILLPTGEVFEKDRDEIEAALQEGVITQEQYDLAYVEFHGLLKDIKAKRFPYVEMSVVHKTHLQNIMPPGE